MKLLVDNQLPMQLALEFRRRGDECLHVLELQLDRATDIILWEHAKNEGQIVVSKERTSSFLPIVRAMWVA